MRGWKAFAMVLGAIIAAVAFETRSDLLRYIKIKRIDNHPELVPAEGRKAYSQSSR